MNAKRHAEVLDMIDTAIGAGIDPEDAVILKSAAMTETQKVAGAAGQQSGANRSADARAWTMGGSVD